MEIILCATQSHLATAWRDRIGSRLSATVRVVEGDILSLDVTAVVSPANSFGFMDGGLDGVYTRFFGPQLQQRLQGMIREQAGGELLVGQALLVETGHPHIRWCISSPTMRVPTLLDTPLPAYLATRAAVRCALDAGLESVAIPGMGTGTGGLAPPGGRRCHALGYPGCPLSASFPGLSGGRSVVLRSMEWDLVKHRPGNAARAFRSSACGASPAIWWARLIASTTPSAPRSANG